jgi:hypothetical protein
MSTSAQVEAHPARGFGTSLRELATILQFAVHASRASAFTSRSVVRVFEVTRDGVAADAEQRSERGLIEVVPVLSSIAAPGREPRRRATAPTTTSVASLGPTNPVASRTSSSAHAA